MGTDPELETERLRLRRWRSGDREPFAALNADPEVARYLPGPLTRAQSDRLVERIEGTSSVTASASGWWKPA
jgi:RimJ/RimL family protein N-acetyltransferase